MSRRSPEGRCRLTVEPRSPRVWKGSLSMLHAAAVAAIALAALPLWLQIVLWGLTGASLARDWFLGFPLCGTVPDLRKVSVTGNGDLTLEGVSGSLGARLLPTTVLWDAALFLRLKAGSRLFTLVLPAASVSKENYRRMRICLGAVLDRTHRASGPSAI